MKTGLTLLAAVAAACASSFAYYDATKPHHTPEGFRNNYPHPEKTGCMCNGFQTARASMLAASSAR